MRKPDPRRNHGKGSAQQISAALMRQRRQQAEQVTLTLTLTLAPTPALTVTLTPTLYLALHLTVTLYLIPTRLLMPLLERGGGSAARIISVASEASHAAKPLDPSFFRDRGEGDLRGEVTHNHAPLGTAYLSLNLALDVLPSAMTAFGATGFVPTYMRAKYANVLYARALSERLNQTHAKRSSKRRVLSAA